MTSEVLVFDASIERLSLEEELQRAGFSIIDFSKVKGHKRNVFRSYWRPHAGHAWVLLWGFGALTTFVFARAARFLAAFLVITSAAVMAGLWYPAVDAIVIIVAAALVWLLAWGTMPRWRAIAYAPHVFHLGFTRSPPIPKNIASIADRFVSISASFKEAVLEVELFGADPFLAVKRRTGLFGVEVCYIAAWNTDVPEFDKPYM